jgi:hypothetical protein
MITKTSKKGTIDGLGLSLRRPETLKEIGDRDEPTVMQVYVKGTKWHDVNLSKRKFYRALEAHVRKNGKLYRGYGFSCEDERDAAIVRAMVEGLKPESLETRTANAPKTTESLLLKAALRQAMEGIKPEETITIPDTLSLSAFPSWAGKFAASDTFGVIFEIDQSKVEYHRLKFRELHATHISISKYCEFEFRTQYIPSEAITGVYLTNNGDSFFSSSHSEFEYRVRIGK